MECALTNWLMISLATSAMAITLTKSSLTEIWRTWLLVRMTVKPSRTRYKILHGLFSCPYCMSHWIAPILVWNYYPESRAHIFGFIVASFAIVASAAIVSCVIGLLMKISK